MNKGGKRALRRYEAQLLEASKIFSVFEIGILARLFVDCTPERAHCLDPICRTVHILVHHVSPFMKEGVKVAATRVLPTLKAFLYGPLHFGESKNPGPVVSLTLNTHVTVLPALTAA